MNRRFVFLLLITLCLCASVAFAKKKETAPAAVDSLTKTQADSLAKSLFGEAKDEDKARREFEKGQADFREGEAFLMEADSMRRAGIDTVLKKPTGVAGFFKQNFGDTSLTSRELETRKRAETVFRRAAKEFEKALEIQPGYYEAQLWLAATYDRLKEWDQSLILYREVLNQRQGEDRLWFSFGYAALQAGQFEKAANGFEQAIRVSLMVSGDSAKIPNRYRTYAGEAFVRVYQDGMALERFRQAILYADSNEAKSLRQTVEWIQWDSGGIATVEYRDAAYKAEHDEKWDDAQQAYLGGLKVARTDRAKQELSHRLALLEFRHGTRTDGLLRMKQLVEGKSEAPVEYRENYGKMLYAYGQILEKENDKRGALGYYLQSTKLEWSGQGGGYVEIARIAANDLDTAIGNATKALSYPISAEQKQAAYRILMESYRSKGNFDLMKKYRELLEGKP